MGILQQILMALYAVVLKAVDGEFHLNIINGSASSAAVKTGDIVKAKKVFSSDVRKLDQYSASNRVVVAENGNCYLIDDSGNKYLKAVVDNGGIFWVEITEAEATGRIITSRIRVNARVLIHPAFPGRVFSLVATDGIRFDGLKKMGWVCYHDNDGNQTVVVGMKPSDLLGVYNFHQFGDKILRRMLLQNELDCIRGGYVSICRKINPADVTIDHNNTSDGDIRIGVKWLSSVTGYDWRGKAGHQLKFTGDVPYENKVYFCKGSALLLEDNSLSIKIMGIKNLKPVVKKAAGCSIHVEWAKGSFEASIGVNSVYRSVKGIAEAIQMSVENWKSSFLTKEDGSSKGLIAQLADFNEHEAGMFKKLVEICNGNLSREIKFLLQGRIKQTLFEIFGSKDNSINHRLHGSVRGYIKPLIGMETYSDIGHYGVNYLESYTGSEIPMVLNKAGKIIYFRVSDQLRIHEIFGSADIDDVVDMAAVEDKGKTLKCIGWRHPNELMGSEYIQLLNLSNIKFSLYPSLEVRYDPEPNTTPGKGVVYINDGADEASFASKLTKPILTEDKYWDNIGLGELVPYGPLSNKMEVLTHMWCDGIIEDSKNPQLIKQVFEVIGYSASDILDNCVGKETVVWCKTLNKMVNFNHAIKMIRSTVSYCEALGLKFPGACMEKLSGDQGTRTYPDPDRATRDAIKASIVNWKEFQDKEMHDAAVRVASQCKEQQFSPIYMMLCRSVGAKMKELRKIKDQLPDTTLGQMQIDLINEELNKIQLKHNNVPHVMGLGMLLLQGAAHSPNPMIGHNGLWELCFAGILGKALGFNNHVEAEAYRELEGGGYVFKDKDQTKRIQANKLVFSNNIFTAFTIPVIVKKEDTDETITVEHTYAVAIHSNPTPVVDIKKTDALIKAFCEDVLKSI